MVHCVPGEHFHCSWAYAMPEFREELRYLREKPLVEDDSHHLVNESHGKAVWRCRCGTFDVAYKTQRVETHLRFLFNHSLPAREWRNYQAIAAMGIPVPRVLAVGDVRQFFWLQETFIVTEFLENTHDGRIFMRDGDYRQGHDVLRRAYCLAQMEYLAIFHDHGWLHAAFHPRNLLFREPRENAQLQAFWIDVARARPVSDSKRNDAAVRDLCTFFHDLRITESEIAEYVATYAARRKTVSRTAREWLEELKRSPRWNAIG